MSLEESVQEGLVGGIYVGFLSLIPGRTSRECQKDYVRWDQNKHYFTTGKILGTGLILSIYTTVACGTAGLIYSIGDMLLK